MNGTLRYSSGNDIVDQISKINITGNVTPIIWYQTVCNGNGKPNWVAVNVLSDIVYWYRPTEVRDEMTGQLIGFRKKFKAEYLQRSYRQLGKNINISKRQAMAAVDCLVELGVIRKHIRNETTKSGQQLYNVMYLELVADKLNELTYPELNQNGVVQKNVVPYDEKCTTLIQEKEQGSVEKSTTNTKNTTENTTLDYINPIRSDIDGVEKAEISLDKIKEQLDYKVLCNDYPYDIDKIDGIVDLIEDILFLDDAEMITVNRQKIPAYKVKRKYLELNMYDVQYVIDGISQSGKKVINMRAFLLTSLYNAPITKGLYMANWVSSDRARLAELQMGAVAYNGISIDELENELLANNS